MKTSLKAMAAVCQIDILAAGMLFLMVFFCPAAWQLGGQVSSTCFFCFAMRWGTVRNIAVNMPACSPPKWVRSAGLKLRGWGIVRLCHKFLRFIYRFLKLQATEQQHTLNGSDLQKKPSVAVIFKLNISVTQWPPLELGLCCWKINLWS